MQRLKKLTITLAAILPVFTMVLMPSAVHAQSPAAQSIQQGACDAAGQQNCSAEEAASSINDTIKSVINILSVVVGIVAVIMLIIGGMRYITSSGNEQSVGAAKKTILYAVIGLIIVALAQVIVRFVLHATVKNSSSSSSSSSSNSPDNKGGKKGAN